MSQLRDTVNSLKDYLESRIVGQEALVKKLLIALLADGHVLVEGAPGLAKTKAVKTLAECVSASFSRIQFTPDLLPSDITGSDIFAAEKGQFEFRKGPVFANLVLADEINRAPAKVQSALLEAMGERQVSVLGRKYPLPPLFMVMATQNPIEHEGTYPLPEAQLDRFLMHVKVAQPDAAAERKILNLVRAEETGCGTDAQCWRDAAGKPFKIGEEDIVKARFEAGNTHVSEPLSEYIVQLVMATRSPEKYGAKLNGVALEGAIAFGASPRATIALDRCARINAWLEGRDFAAPEDVHFVAHDILRHRVILSFDALAEGITPDAVVDDILRLVPLP